MPTQSNCKETEVALSESEERFRLLFQTLPDPVTIIQAKNGRCVDVNDAFVDLTGWSREEVIGKTAADINIWCDPADRTRLIDGINRDGYIQNLEVKFRFKTGRVITGLISAAVLTIHTKPHIVTIVRDITARKKAETALKANERFLQNIFDGITDGISILDKDMNIVRVNATMEKLYSHRKPLVGEKCYFIYQGGETPCESCPSVRAMQTKTACVEEVPLTGEDGIDGHLELHAFPILDENNNVSGAIEFVRDITDRRKADQALKKNEGWLKAVFEAIPDPIVVYDRQGHPLYLNPAFTRVFGWTWEELKATRIPFVPDDQQEITAQKTKNIFESGEPQRFESKRLTKDGKTLDTFISAAIIKGTEKKFTGMVVSLTDITERKRLVVQLQQAQKMEAIGTLAGGIAHDFNNLLMGIQGRNSIMLMDIEASNPFYDHIKGIEEYVKKASDLTRQMLGFARGGKYEVRAVDINRLIRDQDRMFGRTRKEISIDEKFEKELWTVEADQGQMEQVLLNLYINAWQAMPGGGHLYIRTENVTLVENDVKPYDVKPGRYVKISVTDTGIGMDSSTVQKVFDPFFTTKERGRGTGLGLASVYGIVHNHGGFINLTSKKGEGTTFNIYLSASEKKVTVPGKTHGKVQKGSGTVLLVDDEDFILDVGSQMLGRLGYKVITAGGGEEAIELYRKNQDAITIIILDMIMPNLGGGATIDRLNKIDSNVKVLLSSGYSINGQASEILKRGCHGFIQKPFDMKSLSKKISEILQV